MGSKIVDLVRSAENSGSVDGAPPRAQSLGGLSEIAQAIVDLSGKVGSKIDAVESAAVIHAMNVCHGNQSAAARLLGMERKAFVRRLHRAQRRRT